MSDKDAKLESPTSPDGNSTNDELEHNNNVFDIIITVMMIQ